MEALAEADVADRVEAERQHWPGIGKADAVSAMAPDGDLVILVDCAVCGGTHAPGTDDDPRCPH